MFEHEGVSNSLPCTCMFEHEGVPNTCKEVPELQSALLKWKIFLQQLSERKKMAILFTLFGLLSYCKGKLSLSDAQVPLCIENAPQSLGSYTE